MSRIYIKFEVEIWGDVVLVEISEQLGTGGTWTLDINRGYWGCFVVFEDKWDCRLHRPPGWFTMADMRILEDMVEEAMPAKSSPGYLYGLYTRRAE